MRPFAEKVMTAAGPPGIQGDMTEYLGLGVRRRGLEPVSESCEIPPRGVLDDGRRHLAERPQDLARARELA
jgi:hypothetical protein